MTKRSTFATGALALSMLTAACNAAASPSASAVPSGSAAGVATTAAALPQACTLLTEADAVPALNAQGHDVGGPDENMGGLNNCMWGDDTAHTTVQIAVFDRNTFEQNRASAGSGVTITPVSGVGDDAFFKSSEALGTLLFVRKGNLAFEVYIRAPTFTKDQIMANEQAAAVTVVGRL